MEIKLLSPIDNTVVEILPDFQGEILASLPKTNSVLENSFTWHSPNATDRESTTPRYINFSWGFDGSLTGVVAISLFISQHPDFSEESEYPIMPGQAFLSLTNLKRNTEYFWRIIAFSKDGPVCESATERFRTSDALPQWYKMSGATNLRDIGGWRAADTEVCEGMLFRGSEIGDFAGKNDILLFLKNDLKIKTEIDLRFNDEILPFNKKIHNADYFQIDVQPYGFINADEQKQKYGKIFKILANGENYPIYLHCVAGSDRTGTVVALLKFLLGVSSDDVATDYELSSLSPYGMRSRFQEAYRSLIDYLLTLGDTLQQGAKNYLLSCGVTELEIDSIKEILLK